MKFRSHLRSAIAQDGVGYVTGLAAPVLFHIGTYAVPIIFPISTLWAVGKQLKKLIELETVDWALPNWQGYYHKELSSTLEIQYRTERHRLPQVLLHENASGEPLKKFQIALELGATPFALSPEVQASTEQGFERVLRRLKKRPNHYEEASIRLIAIDSTSDGIKLKVQPVSYRDYAQTNLFLDYRDRRTRRLRDLVHPGGALEPLGTSRLANHIGINVLVFTADGRVVLQKRSKKVGIRPGEYAPSGSGGMTLADAQNSAGRPVRSDIVMRETVEEIGVGVDPAVEASLTYMATTRELIRGGMPELFFAARSNLSESDVLRMSTTARDRYEFATVRAYPLDGSVCDLVSLDDAHALSSSLDNLLDKIWNEASIPLLTALALWVRQKTRVFRIGDKPTSAQTGLGTP